jgi:hypothetical protein
MSRGSTRRWRQLRAAIINKSTHCAICRRPFTARDYMTRGGDPCRPHLAGRQRRRHLRPAQPAGDMSPLQPSEGVEDAAPCVGSVAMSHGPFVIVEKQRRDGQPVRAVSYLEPEADWDSGFALFRGESGISGLQEMADSQADQDGDNDPEDRKEKPSSNFSPPRPMKKGNPSMPSLKHHRRIDAVVVQLEATAVGQRHGAPSDPRDYRYFGSGQVDMTTSAISHAHLSGSIPPQCACPSPRIASISAT